jgi:hypothetical protein
VVTIGIRFGLSPRHTLLSVRLRWALVAFSGGDCRLVILVAIGVGKLGGNEWLRLTRVKSHSSSSIDWIFLFKIALDFGR